MSEFKRLTMRACRGLMLMLGLLMSGIATAQTLFGIVSERSAPSLASGADEFAKAHPGHRLILRTTSQLAELTDTELGELMDKADAILLAAVFGEDIVPRLSRLLDARDNHKMLLAVHSDRRLVERSIIDGVTVFSGLDPDDIELLHGGPGPENDPVDHRAGLSSKFPRQARWLEGQAYWEGRGSDNLAALLGWLLTLESPDPRPLAQLRIYQHGNIVNTPVLADEKPLIAVLDLDSGDEAGNRALHDQLCKAIEQRGLQCMGLLARWGVASRDALESLSAFPQLAGIVSLQDFVIGGGGEREAAIAALEALDVPLYKGIRLAERTVDQWRISEDGMPWESVNYQLAMPELQGASQPLLLSAAGQPQLHQASGLRLQISEPIAEQITHLAERVERWRRLQKLPNSEKRLAVIYYNHPPGRHNIGADNLDVPASLWDLLHSLKNEGYDTGSLPESPEALLSLIQARGINLPENRQAMKALSGKVESLDIDAYRQYFNTLPPAVQHEMTHGPLGYLQVQLRRAEQMGEVELGRRLMDRTLGDLHHLLEGTDHSARPRALDLLDQLKVLDAALLEGKSSDWSAARELVEALSALGIEGIRGWGEPPGRSMTIEDRMLFPGLRFGKIFIGPQPPRGWELNEELLHANTTIPPTHQYLGFYHWLRNEFSADAIVHLGRHSTFEFLPRRRAAMGADDYPTLIAGDVPGIYPYIVDGVGEGIQAKRRGLAVMVDHLTPPLKTTPLYDELLELRQLVESWESATAGSSSTLATRAMSRIRQTVEALELQDELIGTIAEEHGIDGLTYDNVDEAMLVHEIGHYLTDLQEAFMPHGLHVFGRDWSAASIDLMLESMGDSAAREALTTSPKAERTALLSALNGRFVKPGKGNDPIRSPESLPTGRNFHALDGGVMPTRLAYGLGLELAVTARADDSSDGRSAVVLWASDTVRDEGAMVAFGMGLLGIRPVWNSRGIVSGLERVDVDHDNPRRDVLFTTSGLFRDLYPNLLVWLDRAVLLALDGASQTIRSEHPDLAEALEGALAPLGEFRKPGLESLAANEVARNWVSEARQSLEADLSPKAAGRAASLRLFGDAPGAYGAGVNRLVERSGAWSERSEVAAAYLQRMGHAYGIDQSGTAQHASFRQSLSKVRQTYLGRASNLYGLMDNNDAFDYLGGLSLAVETISGTAPDGRVIEHADADNASIERLDVALLQELRGRYLNPAWIKPLMTHDYAGARTMGSEFLEYLWGWQVTNPDIIESWVWDEVKAVYLDDSHQLGLDDFLEQGHNVHVKANMEALMLVAAHKGFWQADDGTLDQLAEQFAQHVVANGLPGSGHTRPDHPMLDWIEPRLDETLKQQLREVRAAARQPQPVSERQPVSITEIKVADSPSDAAEAKDQSSGEEPADLPAPTEPLRVWILAIMLLLLLMGGIYHGTRVRATGAITQRSRHEH
ncbi:cobaltochelatase subunit CobN [Allohahella marinimesophila]|uniref:CobN/magnesium chelatase domain-containing protein n=1 Tax=Allohahella marinimesophila TaxID=1054972 RepID=A0ABP7P0Z7_9GAMM